MLRGIYTGQELQTLRPRNGLRVTGREGLGVKAKDSG